MGFGSRFAEIDRKFAWSFLGFLVGIVGIIWAVYATYFYEKRPQLVVDVLSNVRVLDVRENVGKMDIVYDGASLLANRKMLSVLSVRISNVGQESITLHDYDPSDLVGIQIPNGRIVQSETTSTSNSYLGKHLQWQHGPDSLTLHPIIFEPADYVDVKLLVIHDSDRTASVTAFGKIARVRSIELHETYRPHKPSFVTRVFAGSADIQIVRAVTYFIIALLFIAFVFLVMVSLIELVRRSGRKRTVKAFRASATEPIQQVDQMLLRAYVRMPETLRLAHELVRDNELGAKYLETFEKHVSSFPRKDKNTKSARLLRFYEMLKDANVVVDNNGTRALEPRFAAVVNRFFSLAPKSLSELWLPSPQHLDEMYKGRAFLSELTVDGPIPESTGWTEFRTPKT